MEENLSVGNILLDIIRESDLIDVEKVKDGNNDAHGVKEEVEDVYSFIGVGAFKVKGEEEQNLEEDDDDGL